MSMRVYILNLNTLFQYYKTLNIVTPAAPLPYHIFYSIHLPPLTHSSRPTHFLPYLCRRRPSSTIGVYCAHYMYTNTGCTFIYFIISSLPTTIHHHHHSIFFFLAHIIVIPSFYPSLLGCFFFSLVLFY